MYYYFAATLPMLHFDGNLPFSVDTFVEDCQRLLKPDDVADILIALERSDGQPKSVVLRQWQEFSRCLKNEIAWGRAAARQQNPTAVIQGERAFDAEVTNALTQTSRTENLLEAQIMLLQMQWHRADQLVINQFFSIDFILMYGVKLRLLERLNAFKSGQGAALLEKMVSQAAQQNTALAE